MGKFLFSEIVFCHADIILLNLALGRVLPVGQAHVWLGGVGTVIDELGGGLAGDGVMELVLDGGEKGTRGLGGGVVVKSRGVDIGDLLVETTFGEANLANLLEEFVEVALGEARTAVFKTLFVHGPTLDGKVLDDGVGPFAELDGAGTIDLEADSDNHP